MTPQTESNSNSDKSYDRRKKREEIFAYLI